MPRKKKTEATESRETILNREISDDMEQSYIDYSMSVITDRAIPDVRDGMKPVHRRILYGMSHLGIGPDKPHKKSARIVGEVMGKYHPHGDSSIYQAMVRMSQDFSMRYPLVDGHGNFGSIDGDGAAASRYTEARMSPFSLEMIRDIDKNTVDFRDNFDGEEKEPVVLPSRIPNILLNGSNGIAVGMATNIPPHNICDVIDACIYMIENRKKKKLDIEELIKTIKGPDFPTGGLILGRSGIEDMYRTGQGKIGMRAKVKIEESSRGKHNIIITEIPYGVNKAKLIEQIAKAIKEKKVQGITELRDESSREGLRIFIEVRKDFDPDVVLNRLYINSDLQCNFGAIILALDNNMPKIMSLDQILKAYLEFQREVIVRRTQYDLEKAKTRLHIVEGLIKALDQIDAIVKTIRSAYNDAKERLMKKFKFSDLQAQAILDMRLQRLQGLEKDKLEKEYKQLVKDIDTWEKILASEAKQYTVLKKELLQIRDEWGDKRRTKIVRDDGEITVADIVDDRKLLCCLTKNGFASCITEDRLSKIRGENSILSYGDIVSSVTETDLLQTAYLFSDKGNAYKMLTKDIPETRAEKGLDLRESTGMLVSESLVGSAVSTKGGKGVILVTSDGYIKRLSYDELLTRNRKVSAIGLHKDASLVFAGIDDGKRDMILFARSGKAIRFNPSGVRAMGRSAAGVRAMDIAADDYILGADFVSDDDMLFVSINGFGKQFAAKQIKKQARGGKGLLVWSSVSLAKFGGIDRAACFKDGLAFIVDDDYTYVEAGKIPVGERDSVGETFSTPGDVYRLFI